MKLTLMVTNDIPRFRRRSSTEDLRMIGFSHVANMNTLTVLPSPSDLRHGVNAGLNVSGFFIISTIEFFFSHQYDSMISQVFDVSFKSTLVWKGRK